jgi:hypothetical protein
MTNNTWTTQGMIAQHQIALIDDAFCDIIQDQYSDLTPAVLRSLEAAIDRLRTWREENGYLDL